MKYLLLAGINGIIGILLIAITSLPVVYASPFLLVAGLAAAYTVAKLLIKIIILVLVGIVILLLAIESGLFGSSIELFKILYMN